jgi:lipid-A-disaccharide synthase
MTLDSTHPNFFIFAGELSGDMHGSMLMKALKVRYPELSFFGVAGPSMRLQGVTGVLRMEDFEVMGFSDVLRSFPRLWQQFYRVRDAILASSPQAAIFIDSPSFSLRMAAALRKAGYKGKIVQYICPTVWAWGTHRIQQMAETFDLLLTIFPFEAAYFANSSLNVQYVGNPLQEAIQKHQYDPYWYKLFRIKHTDQLVALFPGSRVGEIRRNLPKQLEAAKLLHQENPEISFAISCAHEHNMELIQDILLKSQLQQNREVYFVPKEYSYELMRTSRSAIAKSGTVTLELALHKCPTVVVYELTTLNRLIAKYLLRVNLSHYCIVNILRGKTVFPELIAEGVSSQKLYQNLKLLHEAGTLRDHCIKECEEVQLMFKEDHASERAAQAIANTVMIS